MNGLGFLHGVVVALVEAVVDSELGLDAFGDLVSHISCIPCEAVWYLSADHS